MGDNEAVAPVKLHIGDSGHTFLITKVEETLLPEDAKEGDVSRALFQ